MTTPDCVVHGLGEDLHGPDGFLAFHAAYRDAFPDLRVTVDHLVAEGDYVAARWRAAATHRGGGLGFAATHKPVVMSGMVFTRLENGKLAEGWNSFDQLGMLQQLGVVNL